MERRLAAILVADVVGYSRLMQADETATHEALKEHRSQLFDPKIAEHNGRIVKLMGDGALVEFPSVVEAVQCAVEIQHALAARQTNLPDEPHIALRIGINLGDVIIEEDDIYGDGVNVAARLEGLADAGGICVSHTVYDQVRDKLPLTFEDLGEQQVKNIARPVRTYSVHLDEAASQKNKSLSRPPRVAMRTAGYAAMALAVLVAAFGLLGWWQPWTADVHPTPSIAVLPFTNQSGDAAQEYFSDGLTEDIISALSRFSELTILSRNAVFTYKGNLATPKQIGRELGVRYLVDGSVRRSGDRVRVSAQLSDVEDGSLLWSDKFDEKMDDIFVLQDNITHKVVGTLIGRLNLVEEERAFAKPTESLKAYDYALRGRSYFHEGKRAANFKARELFESAIEQDPNYASAHIWLARTYLNDAVFGWAQWPSRSLQRSFELVQKAIGLDSSNGISHALLAEIYTYKQRYDLAAAEAVKAIEFNPSHADGHAIRGLILIYQGRPDEAIPFLETARRFNPNISPDWSNMLGIAYFLEKRYADAISLLEGLGVQNPEFAYSYVALAAVYGETGDRAAAAKSVENVRRLAPFFDASGFSQQYIGEAYRARFTEALEQAGFK